MSTLIIFTFFIAINCQEYFPNFDTMVSDFVSKKASSLSKQILWWDLYGNHPEIKRISAYAKYRLTARVCNFLYAKTADVTERPCFRNVRHMTNVNVTSGVKFLLHGTRELISFYQWNITKGIQMKRTVNIHIPVPPLEKELAPPVWEVDVRQPINKVIIGRHKFVFDSKPYKIPKSNYVKAEFAYMQRTSVVTWQAVVELEGAVAIKYATPHKGHNLWFYPLSEISNKQFTSDGQCRLKYPINGLFLWTQQLNATVKISTYELAEGQTKVKSGQKPTKVDYFVPNKLTLYGLKRVKLNYPSGKFFQNKVLMKKTN